MKLAKLGIQTLQQLDFTDPLPLLVRTKSRLKPLDLVGQDFLATLLGGETREPGSIGICGAVEVTTIEIEFARQIASIATISATLRICPASAENAQGRGPGGACGIRNPYAAFTIGV
jgi:hypothetical protein